MPTTKNAFAGTSKGLYDSSGARVTDVNKIKEQYAEYKDTGSFQKGYDVRDLGATTPSSTSTGGTNQNTTATGGSTSPAPTVDDKINSVQDNQQKVDLQVIQAQKDAYENNKRNEQKIEDNFSQNQIDTANYAKENLNNTEDYYNQNEALIKQQNADISAIEAKQEASYQARIDRDTILLEEKKQSETAYLKAQQEKQRLDNAEAIRQAKVDVEIERQQSAWGYQKIGLGFSSGIINQSQQIATEGIMKIAEIKANMTMQEAQMTAKIADIEFNYANLVNSTIDTYTDKIDSVRKDAITRINETNQSLIKNTYDKKADVDKIKEWARTEKLKAEQQHILDIQGVKDKGVEYLKDIQSSVQEYQKRELTKLDTALTNGTIVNMSPQEIAQKEASLGLPAGTIEAQMNTSIAQGLNAQITELTGVATMPLNPALIGEVKSEMKNRGMTWDEAVKLVVNREAKTNPEMAQAIEAKNNAVSLEDKKTQAEINRINNDIYMNLGDGDVLNKETGKVTSTRTGEVSSDWAKLDDGTLFNKKTGSIKIVEGASGNTDYSTPSISTEDFIHKWEGTRLEAYQDSGGVWTIGNGATQIDGKPVQPGQTLTQEQSDALFQKDLARHQTWKNTIDESTIPEELATALTSLEFNVGSNNQTFKTIQQKIKAGDIQGALSLWDINTAKGKYVQGLQNRRDDEKALIMSGYNRMKNQETVLLNSKLIAESDSKFSEDDLETMTNEDKAKKIIELQKKAKGDTKRASISDATKPLLERIKKDSVIFGDSVDKDDVKSAYEALLKDGFTQDEALDQLTLANDELEIKNGVVYEKDFLTKDDYIFNSNKE